MTTIACTHIDLAINAVLTGKIAPLGPREAPSGIDKQPIRGRVEIHDHRIAGDQQGDPRHHGGPEKAIHHYPFDHYQTWQQETPAFAARLASPGAFGENISTTGLTEADICIGDIFKLGSARVQVSQGRQPCWKLNERFDDKHMARRVQETGRTGWYYRILEEGDLAAGDRLVLLDRPAPEWSLARIQHLLYRDTLNLDDLASLSTLEPLAESWRLLAKRRVERGAVESWSSRLERREDHSSDSR